MTRLRKKKTYIFFRKEGWTPFDFWDDKEAIENAQINPGVLRIETALSAKVVWTKPTVQ